MIVVVTILISLLAFKILNYLLFFIGSIDDSYAKNYCFLSWKNICRLYKEYPSRFEFCTRGINDYRHLYYRDVVVLISPIAYEKIKFASFRHSDVSDRIISELKE